jgi:hypothetical protein
MTGACFATRFFFLAGGLDVAGVSFFEAEEGFGTYD